MVDFLASKSRPVPGGSRCSSTDEDRAKGKIPKIELRACVRARVREEEEDLGRNNGTRETALRTEALRHTC